MTDRHRAPSEAAAPPALNGSPTASASTASPRVISSSKAVTSALSGRSSRQSVRGVGETSPHASVPSARRTPVSSRRSSASPWLVGVSGQSVPASQARSTSRPWRRVRRTRSQSPLRERRRGSGAPWHCTSSGPKSWRVSGDIVGLGIALAAGFAYAWHASGVGRSGATCSRPVLFQVDQRQQRTTRGRDAPLHTCSAAPSHQAAGACSISAGIGASKTFSCSFSSSSASTSARIS
jgi:hypothetical protein